METSPEPGRDLTLLEQIERDPDVTQASMATRLGVAVGTVNLLIKRLIDKGYVKVKRANRRKLRYIITPEGLTFRALLTVDYIEQSLLLYRKTRQRVRELLMDVKSDGFDRVQIVEAGEVANVADIADICRLTCLEQGIQVVVQQNVPSLVVNGTKVVLLPSRQEDKPDEQAVEGTAN